MERRFVPLEERGGGSDDDGAREDGEEGAKDDGKEGGGIGRGAGNVEAPGKLLLEVHVAHVGHA